MTFPAVRTAFLSCVAVVALAGAAAAESTVETLRAGDGFPIAISYYPAMEGGKAAGGAEAPVVVLLHGSDKGRILWDKAAPARGQQKNFAETLQTAGYAVITVDLRKFGDSKLPGDNGKLRPDDWLKMSVGDMAAVKQYIFEKHQDRQLNMNKMAIVAAGPTAPVAINFAAIDWNAVPYDDAPVLANRTPRGQDVRALVLLSPETAAGRVNVNQGLGVIRNPALGVAMLVVAGTQDSQDKGQSKKIFELMEKAQRKDDTRVYMLTPNLKDREVGLIGKAPSEVEDPILNFLNKHVKSFPSQWRDRKNKVTG